MEDKLLHRYIMDKAGKRERREVVDWINESQENLERFASLRAQYVFSGFPNSILPEPRRLFRPVIVNIAALLAIPLLAAVIWLLLSRDRVIGQYAEASRQIAVLQDQGLGDITYIANPGTKSLVVLPDSSTVRLNGASILRVPSRFGSSSRELFLSGEGYFDIRHHDDWPMNIHTSKGVVIKVLGTTFDLSAYDNDESVNVTLIEGKVLVREENSGSEHELKPMQEIKLPSVGESSAESRKAPVIRAANVQKNTAWVNGELVFDNTPMPEIIKQLERWYGVHVHVADQDILDYRLTATFTTESVTRVLDLIRFSSMLQYTISGTEVYLRKDKR